MTYASDLFSWYAGSVEADVYFCPERHGTYFGGFYIKDAPAIGHEGYGIDEQLTATAGAALCDSSKGYVTAAAGGADVEPGGHAAGQPLRVAAGQHRPGAHARSPRCCAASSTSTAGGRRRRGARCWRCRAPTASSTARTTTHYATVFAQVYETLTADQKTRLAALRKSIMSGTYADGTPFDFSVCTTPFLYSAVITDPSVLDPYVADTDYLFFEP